MGLWSVGTGVGGRRSWSADKHGDARGVRRHLWRDPEVSRGSSEVADSSGYRGRKAGRSLVTWWRSFPAGVQLVPFLASVWDGDASERQSVSVLWNDSRRNWPGRDGKKAGINSDFRVFVCSTLQEQTLILRPSDGGGDANDNVEARLSGSGQAARARGLYFFVPRRIRSTIASGQTAPQDVEKYIQQTHGCRDERDRRTSERRLRCDGFPVQVSADARPVAESCVVESRKPGFQFMSKGLTLTRKSVARSWPGC